MARNDEFRGREIQGLQRGLAQVATTSSCRSHWQTGRRARCAPVRTGLRGGDPPCRPSWRRCWLSQKSP